MSARAYSVYHLDGHHRLSFAEPGDGRGMADDLLISRLCKTMARGTARRDFLRLLGGSLAGTALAALLPRRADAAPADQAGCTPRPPVTVNVSPATDQLTVTVAVTGTGNALRHVAFGQPVNATLAVPGQPSPISTPFTYTAPAGATSLSFAVRSGTSTQAVHVPLTVTDACGDWPTFVGGGVGALRQPGIVCPTGSTTLSAPVAAGATQDLLANPGCVRAGDSLVLDPGTPNEETVQIVATGATGRPTAQANATQTSPTTKSHEANAKANANLACPYAATFGRDSCLLTCPDFCVIVTIPSCTNFNTDDFNCGACGHPCADGGEGDHCVNRHCVCGTSGQPCKDPNVCRSGTCQCDDIKCFLKNGCCNGEICKPQAFPMCPGIALGCVPCNTTISDRCGRGADAQFCVCGESLSSCRFGEVCCTGQCVDTTSNSLHCNGCNKPCSGGRVCQNSQCVCPAGTVDCGGTCCPSNRCINNQCGSACGQDCTGCCTTDGRCAPVDQQTSSLCGTGGATCQNCSLQTPPTVCSNSICTSTCGPSNCSDGCCQGNQCVPKSSQSSSVCGSSGSTCRSCGAGETCTNGVCTGTCSLNTCPRCVGDCVNGACVCGSGPRCDASKGEECYQSPTTGQKSCVCTSVAVGNFLCCEAIGEAAGCGCYGCNATDSMGRPMSCRQGDTCVPKADCKRYGGTTYDNCVDPICGQS